MRLSFPLVAGAVVGQISMLGHAYMDVPSHISIAFVTLVEMMAVDHRFMYNLEFGHHEIRGFCCSRIYLASKHFPIADQSLHMTIIARLLWLFHFGYYVFFLTKNSVPWIGVISGNVIFGPPLQKYWAEQQQQKASKEGQTGST